MFKIRLGGIVAAGALLLVQSNSSYGQNNALQFNGLTDHVKLTTTSVTNMLNGYTLEAWARPTTSSLAHRILSNFQGTPSRGFGFGMVNTSWRHTTFGIKDYNTAADTLTTGVWTHIAVSLDSAHAATFYKNGAFLATVTHNVIARESTHTLYIGCNPTMAEFWEGGIDEIRIWDHIRTPQQIADNYNHRLVGNEIGLIGYYPFNEGSGTTTADVSPGVGDGILTGCTWITGPTLLDPITRAEGNWMQVP